jgi:uncharacterized membrane protein
MYSLIGYVCEVVYCSIPAKRLVNRGFLHGPYLPIYGFGAIIVIFFFQAYEKYPFLIFIAGMISTSILEFFTSWLLEKFFHAKLWDYSTYFGNLKGRVCLLNSTMFGILSVAVIYGIHPLTVKAIDFIPTWLTANLSRVILVGMCIDTTSSVYRMAAFQKQLVELKKKSRELESRLELLQKEKSNQAFELLRGKLTNEYDEIKLRFSLSSKRIVDAFPTITSSNEETKLQIELLKMNLRDYRTRVALHKRKIKQKARELSHQQKKRHAK